MPVPTTLGHQQKRPAAARQRRTLQALNHTLATEASRPLKQQLHDPPPQQTTSSATMPWWPPYQPVVDPGKIIVAKQGNAEAALAEIRTLLAAHPRTAGRRREHDEVALHKAVRHHTGSAQAVELVKLVLDASPACVKVANTNDGDLPLHIAAAHQEGHFGAQIIKLLLAQYPSAARRPNSQNALPLHIAAEDCRPQVLDCLLQAYPKAAFQVDANMNLPLHLAAAAVFLPAKKDVLQRLVEANPAAASQVDAGGLLPLHLAIRCQLSGDQAVAVAASQRLPGSHQRCRPHWPAASAFRR